MQDELGLLQALAAAADAFELDLVARLAQAGGVNEDDGQAANVGRLLNGVARRAGNRGDDGAVMAEELVEQARFAGVGPADDRGADAAAQDLSFVGRAQQFVHEGDAVVEPGDKLILRVGGDVFLGEVNVRLDVRQRLQHFVAQLVDALRELAGELFVGGAQGQFGARVDQVGHGLGLREVNAAVEEGAPGEFAGLSQPGAVRQHGVQDQLRRQNAAVAGDLDDVLARKGARGAHDREQDFINVLPVAHDVAEMDGVCRRCGGLGATPSLQARSSASATASAFGPEIRMTARPPSPSGVAIAAMVSSSIVFPFNTLKTNRRGQ